MRCASRFCLSSRAVRNAIQGRTNASCLPVPGSVHGDSPIVACYCTNATARISYEHEFSAVRDICAISIWRSSSATRRRSHLPVHRLKGPGNHALWIWPTHCAHSRDAAARGQVVSSRVPMPLALSADFNVIRWESRDCPDPFVPLTDGSFELSGLSWQNFTTVHWPRFHRSFFHMNSLECWKILASLSNA
jgi:hypothetical protein